MTCRLDIGGRSCHGVILSVAMRGLFVQTRANPPRGHQGAVTVHIPLPGSRESWILETRITRWYQVPSQLVMLAGGGLGLTIGNVPDFWSKFVANKALVPSNVEIHEIIERYCPPPESLLDVTDIDDGDQ
jgi:hypothetical protein